MKKERLLTIIKHETFKNVYDIFAIYGRDLFNEKSDKRAQWLMTIVDCLYRESTKIELDEASKSQLLKILQIIALFEYNLRYEQNCEELEGKILPLEDLSDKEIVKFVQHYAVLLTSIGLDLEKCDPLEEATLASMITARLNHDAFLKGVNIFGENE